MRTRLPLILSSALPLSLLLVLGAGSLSELSSCVQSLVANGDFDSDITSWSAVDGTGSVRWDVLDADGSTGSGSMFLINSATPEGQNTSVSQCQAISPGASYDLSARIRPENFFFGMVSPASPRRTLHTGFLYVLVNFYTKPSCGGTPRNEFVRLDSDGRNEWQSLSRSFVAPAPAVSARISLAVFKTERAGDLRGNFDDVLLVPSGSAAAEPTALCLGKGRFTARAHWTTPDGQSGDAQAVSLTSDTGYFWFFNPDNVEMIVKVLNGCDFNASFWVFAGGLTNVRVDLAVSDAQSGVVRSYANGQGTAFAPIQDTGAFPACAPGSGAAAARRELARPLAPAQAGCVADAQTLCVNNGRFAVSTRWETPDGQAGAGVPVSLTSDTGYFWFFSAANVEMVVKVLNGCGVNQNFWFFAGGLTNVHVVATVTDTQTGLTRTYTNPQGNAFLPIQATGDFPTCP